MRGVVENLLCLVVRLEWFPLFDADRLELIDHDLVALQPWLSLHEAVERLKETHVIGNRAVEHNVDSIDEFGGWRICSLRQGIKLYLACHRRRP